MIASVLAALIAQAPVATAPAAPPAAESTLSGTVSLGGARLTGNSESTTISFGAAMTRKTPDWIYGFKASAAYGRSTDPNTGVESTTALNASGAVRGARRFGEVIALYLEGVVDTDHLKSIEWRPAGELGISFQLVDEKDGDFQTRSLRVDFGFRGGYEYRFQYYGVPPPPLDPTRRNIPDQTIAAPKAGFGFRYAFSREVILADDFNLLLNMPDELRLLLTNVVKLSTQLNKLLAFSVSYGIAEDSVPPPGKVNLDTTLTLALEMTY